MNETATGADLRGRLTVRAFELAAVDPSLAGLLDPAEQARAIAITHTGTRRDFLAARIAQRLMAAELLGAEPGELEAVYECPECGSGPVLSHGRPGYWRNGVSADVSMSLSRSKGWAVAAMVPAAGIPLGIDVQHIASVGFSGFDGVALSLVEQRRLAQLSPGQRNAWRASVWARKEALAKYSGLGLRTDPAVIAAFPDPDTSGPFAGAQVWEPDASALGLPNGFAVAVACGGPARA
ncbi:4'-phosphopantetheinyl transferase family protein [Specibacter sp. AOP5-B1-6]|uniref:4'-phosphopantetheinyl transferase family protein n=1 Tax=Specibacter sp. AOP5-B1-6 TaxID=3457653 RepID=UPI00402B9C97